jgi:hypothetical protein
MTTADGAASVIRSGGGKGADWPPGPRGPPSECVSSRNKKASRLWPFAAARDRFATGSGRPARSRSATERDDELTVLHAERFQDRFPAPVQATVLDEGQYLCSIPTMHR